MSPSFLEAVLHVYATVAQCIQEVWPEDIDEDPTVPLPQALAFIPDYYLEDAAYFFTFFLQYGRTLLAEILKELGKLYAMRRLVHVAARLLLVVKPHVRAAILEWLLRLVAHIPLTLELFDDVPAWARRLVLVHGCSSARSGDAKETETLHAVHLSLIHI